MDNHTTFTWRSEWIRWFESPWSTIEKFKYANEISSRDVLRILGILTVQKLKTTVGEIHRNYVTLSGFDSQLIKEGLQYDLYVMNRTYLDTLFANFPHRSNEFLFINHILTFCIECIKRGFHSHLHQISFLHYCPFHMIPLQKECPNCKNTFLYECYDKGFSSSFICKCGHMFLQQDRDEPFFHKWTMEEDLQCARVKKWITLGNEEREIFNTLQIYPSKELQQSPHTLNGLLQASNPHCTRSESYITIKSTPRIRKIKGQRQLDENREFENFQEKHIKYRFRLIKLHEDLYESYCKVISSLARQLRKTILKQHKTCINRFYNDPTTMPKCPYAFAYLHWRSQIERYRDPHNVISISRPMMEDPEEVKFPLHPYPPQTEYFEKMYHLWSSSGMDITTESRSSLKWVFGRALADFSLSIFNQYLRYTKDNVEDYKPLSVPFQTSNVRPFFFTLNFLSEEAPHMHLEINPSYLPPITELFCPFETVKSRREPHRKQKIEKAKLHSSTNKIQKNK
ncbi:hypothetical protein EEL31_05290 [Brevibacillus laterosporus]|nr:hypothetical protein [Brevibacillus laterosporus]TPG68024.1 hypothetical protein EEL31_05290 [Brevibacillus laterosporus]